MRTMMTGDVARVVGVSEGTVKSWCKQGLIRPVIPADGPGVHRRFSLVDVLAVALARGLRARGVPLKVAGVALEILRGFTEADLLRAFEDGRRYILIGDHAPNGLVNREEAFGRDFDQAHEDDLLPTIVDVKVLYDKVCAKIGGPVRNRAEVLVS